MTKTVKEIMKEKGVDVVKDYWDMIHDIDTNPLYDSNHTLTKDEAKSPQNTSFMDLETFCDELEKQIEDDLS